MVTIELFDELFCVLKKFLNEKSTNVENQLNDRERKIEKKQVIVKQLNLKFKRN